MTHTRIFLVCRLLFVILASCQILACANSKTVDLIVHNATIIDVRSGERLTGKAVVVNDGVIQQVVPAEQIQNFEARRVIDGTNGFLIPALGDAHVHIGHQDDLKNFVRYGVGLVVNMSGSRLHLDMRDAVQKGTLVGPSIVTMGPTLDGADPTNRLFIPVTPQTAGDIVNWIINEGYDAVKVYQQMDEETLASIIDAADSMNRITAGHVSRSTGIDGALRAGLRFVAHGEELAFESYDEKTLRYVQSTVPELADKLIEKGVTVTPMINYLENIPEQALDLEAYLDSESMSQVPAYLRQSFGKRQGWFSNRDEPEIFAQQILSLKDFVIALTKVLNDRNGKLILGTDAGFGGAVPGRSVHDELRTLVDAGLSTLEALQTATLNMGDFVSVVNQEGASFGAVEKGYVGSFLLLKNDPLEDISATLQIEGVGMAGRWFERSDLAEMDEMLRQQQQEVLPLAAAFENAIVEGDLELARDTISTLYTEFPDQTLISADNCIFLGYRHYYGDNKELAEKLYELCAHMNPHSSALWIHSARALESIGDNDSALEAYQQALAINPWYGDPASAIRRLDKRSVAD